VRDDRPYLEYIQESLERIETYLRSENNAPDKDLLDDPKTLDAVLRRLETLSDAASHLSEALKSRHPEISWREVTDFRNTLAHGYIRVKIDRVWAVLSEDIGPLKRVVERELHESGDSS
jgi:uncharacterized protein with HEPN domain